MMRKRYAIPSWSLGFWSAPPLACSSLARALLRVDRSIRPQLFRQPSQPPVFLHPA